MVKIKRSTNSESQEFTQDSIEGCELRPLSNVEKGWPRAATGVLPGTYYRVVKKDNSVRCFVTIMPDGLKVAWDSCAKCHDHVSICKCKSGVYHPSSVGWIRATYDISYPTQRVTDYSKYYDPFDKNGGTVDRSSEVIRHARKPLAPTSMPKKTSKPVDQPITSKAKSSITVKDIESIDLVELNKQAKKQADKSVRRARSIIRGSKK